MVITTSLLLYTALVIWKLCLERMILKNGCPMDIGHLCVLNQKPLPIEILTPRQNCMADGFGFHSVTSPGRLFRLRQKIHQCRSVTLLDSRSSDLHAGIFLYGGDLDSGYFPPRKEPSPKDSSCPWLFRSAPPWP